VLPLAIGSETTSVGREFHKVTTLLVKELCLVSSWDWFLTSLWRCPLVSLSQTTTFLLCGGVWLRKTSVPWCHPYLKKELGLCIHCTRLYMYVICVCLFMHLCIHIFRGIPRGPSMVMGSFCVAVGRLWSL